MPAAFDLMAAAFDLIAAAFDLNTAALNQMPQNKFIPQHLLFALHSLRWGIPLDAMQKGSNCGWAIPPLAPS